MALMSLFRASKLFQKLDGSWKDHIKPSKLTFENFIHTLETNKKAKDISLDYYSRLRFKELMGKVETTETTTEKARVVFFHVDSNFEQVQLECPLRRCLERSKTST